MAEGTKRFLGTALAVLVGSVGAALLTAAIQKAMSKKAV